jgi:hypothetical protein
VSSERVHGKTASCADDVFCCLWKLVVALPVFCAEMALGGQYMGAGTCGASANYGSTFVQPRDGMLAQFPPGGEGKLWKFCHWLKSWIP